MRAAWSEVPAGRAEPSTRSADRAIADLAEHQHGVVTRTQLRAIGLSESAIGRRIQAGRLHPIHRGVYAVGHRVLGAHGRYTAAVLACGPGAALSHASAAALWALGLHDAEEISVIVPADARRRRPGLRIHRGRDMGDEVTVHRGIAVTTPARTIRDLAATLERRALELLLDRADNAQLADVPSLEAMARAHAGHRGASGLLRALHTHTPGTTLTRSGLEERFLQLCRDHGLPQPRVNATVAFLEVDFLFAAAGLIVETDGYDYHRTRRQFERDRDRDATLTRAGYRTLRFTHRQITSEPSAVAATIGAAVAGGTPQGVRSEAPARRAESSTRSRNGR